jgi:NADPH:quinone reductase-like Zn-dependent oxidoreductase
MFAVYATHADPNDPLAAPKIGERPEPHVPEGWLRVKISHASLNRHDLLLGLLPQRGQPALPDEDIESTIAHELGHIYHGHAVWGPAKNATEDESQADQFVLNQGFQLIRQRTLTQIP